MEAMYSGLLLLALASVSVAVPPPIVDGYGSQHGGKDCYKVRLDTPYSAGVMTPDPYAPPVTFSLSQTFLFFQHAVRYIAEFRAERGGE